MRQLINFWWNLVISGEKMIDDVPDKIRNSVVEKLISSGHISESDIDSIRTAKIAEMSVTCNKLICQGFDVILSDGEKHHFSLTTQDQLNMITLSTMVASGEQVIPYHADGESCQWFSASDITTIINAATEFKTYHITYFNSLKLFIESMIDIQAIKEITYGSYIDEEYQSEVLKTLMEK